jgi:hypothetical protein
MSEWMKVEHRAIINLIKKYRDRQIFQRCLLPIEKISTKGRMIESFLLTESQAIFIITLMKNSEIVLNFKEKLVNQFMHHREFNSSMIVQKQNVEYLENRSKGKIARKECTDVIKKFVEYAESQGSKSANKYYITISNMELAGLFIMEQRYPNAREVMDMKQLNLIKIADEAIAVALEEGMEKGLNYKDCYILAKDRIGMLAKVLPRSPLPALLNKNLQELPDE